MKGSRRAEDFLQHRRIFQTGILHPVRPWQPLTLVVANHCGCEMRALPFSLSLIAAAVAGFSFPHLVDTMEQLIGSEQVRPVVNVVANISGTETLAHGDLATPNYLLRPAGSPIPQAVSEMPEREMPVIEMRATNSGPVAAGDKTELPTKPRTDAMVRTKVIARAGMPTQMAPKPPRRPQFETDRQNEWPLSGISQLFEFAHRGLERVAEGVRTTR